MVAKLFFNQGHKKIIIVDISFPQQNEWKKKVIKIIRDLWLVFRENQWRTQDF